MNVTTRVIRSKYSPNKEETVFDLDLRPENNSVYSKGDLRVNEYIKDLDDLIRADTNRIAGWSIAVSLTEHTNTVDLGAVVTFENGNDALYFAMLFGFTGDLPPWAAKYQPVASAASLIK